MNNITLKDVTGCKDPRLKIEKKIQARNSLLTAKKLIQIKKKLFFSYGLSAFYYCTIYLLRGTKIATITIYFGIRVQTHNIKKGYFTY